MESEANSGSERTKAFDLDRTIALSDGIFAFALTLLVLSISVPQAADGGSSSELWTALKSRESELISYLISFAVIGSFWIRHHKFCGTLKAIDGPFLVINLFYLATIAFIPYPAQLLGDFGDSTAFAVLCVGNLDFDHCLVRARGVLDARRAGHYRSERR